MDWAVTVDVAVTIPGDVDEFIDDVLTTLRPNGAAVGFSAAGDAMDVVLTIEGKRDALDAARAGVTVVRDAIQKAGARPGTVLEVEAITTAEQDRRNAEPSIPPLGGVAELAAMLGVSKQRISELSGKDSFPDPVAVLRAGPVWSLPMLQRFAATWDRRPGRRVGQRPTAPAVASDQVEVHIAGRSAPGGTGRSVRGGTGARAAKPAPTR